jgi:hypothetical protein
MRYIALCPPFFSLRLIPVHKAGSRRSDCPLEVPRIRQSFRTCASATRRVPPASPGAVDARWESEPVTCRPPAGANNSPLRRYNCTKSTFVDSAARPCAVSRAPVCPQPGHAAGSHACCNAPHARPQSAKADFVNFQPRFQPPNTTAGRVTRSPVHPFTRSPVHPFTRSPVHPFTRSPVHPFTRSPVHLPTLPRGSRSPASARSWRRGRSSASPPRPRRPGRRGRPGSAHRGRRACC